MRSRAEADSDDAKAYDAGPSLVAAAMGGDREAVSALWEQHRRWIAAVILAHKPSFEDLDDLLQEVAMTLVSKIDTLRDETNIRSWLRTVAVNAARAAGRSGKYRPRPETSVAPGGLAERAADGPEHGADEEMANLMSRLDRLPDGYREPLLLRVSKNLRSKQIADLLGVPPATVDTRIARARRMLRECDDSDAAGSAGGARDIGGPADRDTGSFPFQPRIAAMRTVDRPQQD